MPRSVPGPLRPAWSVRARVIAAVVVLTGLALLLSGVIVYNRGHALTQERVAAELGRAADEFRALATEGLDAATGARFAAAEPLLRVAVQRSVLAPTEGVLGIVDGRVRWAAQSGVELRLEDDPEFVAAVLPLASASTISQGTLATSLRDYRYLVVPVGFGDAAPSGALVRAVDFGAEEALLGEVSRSFVLVAVGSLLLVGLLIWLLVGRLLEPISWMRRTADEISETDLGARIPVRGADDVSALAETFNSMLDRLEGAVGAQRALLDDVGHELRTPLTIMRGHLELLDPHDPDDVAATRALVLDEADRMGRLVDDLLALAKAERAEFMQPEATDLARLTDETLVKATALGPRHWVLDELAEAEVVLDPQRVAQAWLQLAANAVRFSADGSTVGLGSRIEGEQARLWVRDEGAGIDPADHERVLRRFERGSAAGGSGLGLAIVAAIARAHGGRVEIESERGRGSRISMVVPVRTEEDG
ncbi:Adaptive-response sensory-kinase SasA [Propionicimonas sp. T2.31MG-18]|uniref:sensor histidine kinase n=1 Tax=Propionicimonas sp. T2.31MG-18 TaxID=3157620 RepID=UPI0035E64BBB